MKFKKSILALGTLAAVAAPVAAVVACGVTKDGDVKTSTKSGTLALAIVNKIPAKGHAVYNKTTGVNEAALITTTTFNDTKQIRGLKLPGNLDLVPVTIVKASQDLVIDGITLDKDATIGVAVSEKDGNLLLITDLDGVRQITTILATQKAADALKAAQEKLAAKPGDKDLAKAVADASTANDLAKTSSADLTILLTAQKTDLGIK